MMKKYFNAVELFNKIENVGGPDFFKVYKNEINPSAPAVTLFFHDWMYINEFYTRDKSLWWEKFSEVEDVQPGDTIILVFNN